MYYNMIKQGIYKYEYISNFTKIINIEITFLDVKYGRRYIYQGKKAIRILDEINIMI